MKYCRWKSWKPGIYVEETGRDIIYNLPETVFYLVWGPLGCGLTLKTRASSQLPLIGSTSFAGGCHLTSSDLRLWRVANVLQVEFSWSHAKIKLLSWDEKDNDQDLFLHTYPGEKTALWKRSIKWMQWWTICQRVCGPKRPCTWTAMFG